VEGGKTRSCRAEERMNRRARNRRTDEQTSKEQMNGGKNRKLFLA